MHIEIRSVHAQRLLTPQTEAFASRLFLHPQPILGKFPQLTVGSAHSKCRVLARFTHDFNGVVTFVVINIFVVARLFHLALIHHCHLLHRLPECFSVQLDAGFNFHNVSLSTRAMNRSCSAFAHMVAWTNGTDDTKINAAVWVCCEVFVLCIVVVLCCANRMNVTRFNH